MLLANYYIDHRQYEKALAITGPFYSSHPKDFIMGALHARTLLLCNKYKEADALLTKINIIPYEGATGGHELYREAKLMQAAQLMQKKNFKSALKFISEAGLWPENLGVGQPYPEDIDMRLEDWMKYLCFQQLKRISESEEILKNIVKFEPRIDYTVRNFLPANALVTAWAYERLNKKDEAVQWLNRQIGYFPDYKLLLWSKAVFEKDNTFVLQEGAKDANARIIEQLLLPGM
jgi:tetratricopeptide (TPR) repeat protein